MLTRLLLAAALLVTQPTPTRLLFIGKVLSSEPIGLEEVDEGFWKVYFFNHLLARFDERNRKLIEAPV